MKIYDISRSLYPSMAVWPGDTEYSFDLTWSIKEGSSCNVGKLTMSPHTGTHVDAFFHFKNNGSTIDQHSLDLYVGPALVIHIPSVRNIDVEHLSSYDLHSVQRLLIRTDYWSEGDPFPENIPTLTTAAIQYISDSNIQLIGLDLPSVDRLESKTLENHHLLSKLHIYILESLNLDNIEEGIYELTALPLKIKDGDGSPVRAILRK
jgi:arylformamidase